MELTLARWRQKQWKMSYLQANPMRADFNGMPAKSFVRYGSYKGATTISAVMASDVKWDMERGHMVLCPPLHPPPEDRVLVTLPGDRGEAKYGAWLMVRLLFMPKKSDFSLCMNWRGVCLLRVTSMVLLSALLARVKVVMKKFGFDAQESFRWDRGTIGGLFTFFGVLTTILVIIASLKKSRGKCTRPRSCPYFPVASKLGPLENICFSDLEVFTSRCA
jgi:hypothetical protein